MRIRKRELKVFYNQGTEIDSGLDNALKETLAKFGYRIWATGCSTVSGVRDLAFTKRKKRNQNEKIS